MKEGEEVPVEYNASEQFYNVAKDEYDYEAGRNAVLDNKVSMTLAFCGVLFLFLVNYLDIRSIWQTDEQLVCYQCILRFISSLLQVACLAFFTVSIVKLFLILRPKTYCRLDLNFILKDTLPEWDPKQAYMYLGKRYTEFATFNRQVNERRSKSYRWSILWLLCAVLSCVLNEIITFNFL